METGNPAGQTAATTPPGAAMSFEHAGCMRLQTGDAGKAAADFKAAAKDWEALGNGDFQEVKLTDAKVWYFYALDGWKRIEECNVPRERGAAGAEIIQRRIAGLGVSQNG